jgi:hypothetical protein
LPLLALDFRGFLAAQRNEMLTGRLGLLSPNEMRGVDLAMRIQLGLAV